MLKVGSRFSKVAGVVAPRADQVERMTGILPKLEKHIGKTGLAAKKAITTEARGVVGTGPKSGRKITNLIHAPRSSILMAGFIPKKDKSVLMIHPNSNPLANKSRFRKFSEATKSLAHHEGIHAEQARRAGGRMPHAKEWMARAEELPKGKTRGEKRRYKAAVKRHLNKANKATFEAPQETMAYAGQTVHDLKAKGLSNEQIRRHAQHYTGEESQKVSEKLIKSVSNPTSQTNKHGKKRNPTQIAQDIVDRHYRDPKNMTYSHALYKQIGGKPYKRYLKNLYKYTEK